MGLRLFWCRCGFSFGGFVLNKQVLLWWWVVEDFTTIGTLDLKKSYHHSGPLWMRPNELWTCPHDGAARVQAPGCQHSICRSVRRGRGGGRYSQWRSSDGGWGFRHPRLSNEHIELPAKLRDYFLRSNNSNINQRGTGWGPGVMSAISEWWVRPPWLAFQESQGPKQSPNISLIKQSNTDPATPGCLRSVDTRRKPGTVTIPQIPG